MQSSINFPYCFVSDEKASENAKTEGNPDIHSAQEIWKNTKRM